MTSVNLPELIDGPDFSKKGLKRLKTQVFC